MDEIPISEDIWGRRIWPKYTMDGELLMLMLPSLPMRSGTAGPRSLVETGSHGIRYDQV